MPITQEHIDQFSISLKDILNSELSNRNEVVETSSGWPQPETIIIFLKKPFTREYQKDNIEFREINDPHWWKSEYYDPVSHHILACKYD